MDCIYLFIYLFIYLLRDRDAWRVLASAALKIRVPQNAGNFLNSSSSSRDSDLVFGYWLFGYLLKMLVVMQYN
jgi:hypothetical protein